MGLRAARPEQGPREGTAVGARRQRDRAERHPEQRGEREIHALELEQGGWCARGLGAPLHASDSSASNRGLDPQRQGRSSAAQGGRKDRP
eukprot:10826266-Lingulodinium_polyedra.AAC.1